LLLSDALQEREAQIEINQRKKEIERIIVQKHMELERENQKVAEEKDVRKRMEEEEIKRDQHEKLREQHEEFKLKYIKRMQEEKIEGEIIKKKTADQLEKQKVEDEKRKIRMKALQGEIIQGNEVLKEIRKVEKDKEMEKDKEIAAFAKKKEEIVEMRKMREELRFKEKQAIRQKIIDKQVEGLRLMKNKEDAILNKQIKEAEIKAEEHERIKKEKIQQLAQTIERHSALQIEKKRVDTEKEKMEDKQFQEFWRTKNQDLAQREHEDKMKARERLQDLNDYHKKQTATREKKVEKAFLKELDEAEKMKVVLEEDDKVFSSYAERCLKEWADNGKNIKPLLLELQKYKKKI